MIRIFNHYVSARLVFLVGVDALILMLAAYLGIALGSSGPVEVIANLDAAVPPLAAGFTLGTLSVMTTMGMYQLDRLENAQSVVLRLFVAVLCGVVITFLVLRALEPSFSLGPGALVIAVIVGLTGSVLVRFAFYRWSEVGAFKSRVLVLGAGYRLEKLEDFSQRSRNHVIVGYVALQRQQHYTPKQNILPVTPGETLLTIVKRHAIDQIVVGVRDRRNGGLPLQQLLECRLKGVKITELHSFCEREYRQVLLAALNPSWMIFEDGFRQGFLRGVFKRLLDLLVSGILLVVTMPLLLVAALAIIFESGLPVFYRQERTGENGRAFTLYKLRSMKNSAESDGTPRWAAVNDDRTTRVGRIIRKLRIDELPQIINVFKGEMSFIGPRPERLFFVEQLTQQIPHYGLRHIVKPGITGWAQVNYAYGGSLDDVIEKLQYDLYYVKNHSLFLDLMILIATVEVVVWGKGAR